MHPELAEYTNKPPLNSITISSTNTQPNPTRLIETQRCRKNTYMKKALRTSKTLTQYILVGFTKCGKAQQQQQQPLNADGIVRYIHFSRPKLVVLLHNTIYVRCTLYSVFVRLKENGFIKIEKLNYHESNNFYFRKHQHYVPHNQIFFGKCANTQQNERERELRCAAYNGKLLTYVHTNPKYVCVITTTTARLTTPSSIEIPCTANAFLI